MADCWLIVGIAFLLAKYYLKHNYRGYIPYYQEILNGVIREGHRINN